MERTDTQEGVSADWRGARRQDVTQRAATAKTRAKARIATAEKMKDAPITATSSRQAAVWALNVAVHATALVLPQHLHGSTEGAAGIGLITPY